MHFHLLMVKYFYRVKLYAVFQGLREEGFNLSEILTTEFCSRCPVALEKTQEPHVAQKLLKTGMSLGD